MDNFICVYDFETDGKKPETCEPVQVAACMLHNITLEVVPDSEFCSFMRPQGIDKPDYFDRVKDTIEWHAKNYNSNWHELKKSEREDAIQRVYKTWKDAPEQKQVWADFTTYLLKYNKNQANRTRFKAPIRAGMNVRRYDNIIVDRLCERFGYLTSDKEQKIFHPRDVIDIMEMAFYWFENLEEPKAYNMGALREFFGMSDAGAHDALVDVRDESQMIQKFIRLNRATAGRVKFRNAMAKMAEPAV